MNKIFYIIGKSCSGKDTIYKKLLSKYSNSLFEAIPYTTRPIREGEIDGKEYHFVTESDFLLLKERNKVIENRVYNTIYGPWRYFTVEDKQFEENENLLMIGVLSSYVSVKKYFGEEKVIPIYIDIEDGVRLQRALDREKKEKNPKYQEMCRRFLADSEDFSEKNIKVAGIKRKFINDDLDRCVSEIVDYINNIRRI